MDNNPLCDSSYDLFIYAVLYNNTHITFTDKYTILTVIPLNVAYTCANTYKLAGIVLLSTKRPHLCLFYSKAELTNRSDMLFTRQYITWGGSIMQQTCITPHSVRNMLWANMSRFTCMSSYERFTIKRHVCTFCIIFDKQAVLNEIKRHDCVTLIFD